jgi:hypothetical protein
MHPHPPSTGPRRLDRRTAILRGKRTVAFDPDQYYLERAARARVARKARVLLRRMEPVVLLTPRWSQARTFLDDLTVDLRIGEPQVRARTLWVKPLEGHTPHQAWSWLVLAVQEFCALPLEGPAWTAVSRRGFRHVMRELLARAEDGERRCLMVHGLEHLQVEALRDLIEVFAAHRQDWRGEARFNLLLAGSVDVPDLAFPGSAPLVLEDYAEYEALEALVEQVGPEQADRLARVARLVGGVPALLDRLASELGPRLAELSAEQRNQIWAGLGGLGAEIRRAWDIVSADEGLHARIDELAREGALPPDPAHDEALARAGLVRVVGRTDWSRRTVLRAPVLADLAG